MNIADERKKISDQHERAVIQSFSEYLQRKGYPVSVLPRQKEASQGDGLLKVCNQVQWLEVTFIYQNTQEAMEQWQSVTPGESPPPRGLDVSRFVIPRNFPERLIEGMIKKLQKAAKGIGYLTSKCQWGPGILIADCRDAVVDFDWPIEQQFIVDALDSRYRELLFLNQKEIFKEVYLYVPINWSNQRKFIPFLEEYFLKKTFTEIYAQPQTEELP